MTMSADDVAWQLAEHLRNRLPEANRSTMYCTLGSGDTFDALAAILDMAVRRRQTVPQDIVTQLHAWLDGYLGNPDEPRLRAAVRTIAPL